MIGEIMLNKLSEFVSLLPLKSGYLIYVIDSGGRVVADSRRLRWGQQLSSELLIKKGRDDDSSSVNLSFELDGQLMSGTMVDIQEVGWKVLVMQPTEQVMKPLHLTFWAMAFGLAIALVLTLTISQIQVARLAGVVQAFSEKAALVASGQYKIKWPRAKTQELVNLGESLQRMAGVINRRETALMENEKRLQITLDSIGDGVIATDEKGLVTRMNPMAEKLTGWQEKQAKGQPLTVVFHIVNAQTRQPAVNPVDKVLAEGKVVGLANHTLLMAKDGQEYQIADSGAPIRRTDGEIEGVVLVFRDVTEAYRREQMIREKQKLLENVTDNIPGIVFQFKSTRDHTYSVSFVSAKAETILGLPIKPPHCPNLYEDFLIHIPEDAKERFTASIREAVDNAAPWKYEGQFIKPSGEEIWLSGSAVPQTSGENIIFNGVLMDFTERRRMEEDLRVTRFIFDTAAIGIYRVDSDARILQVNDHAARMLGYTAEELSAMTIFNIDPVVNRECWKEMCDTLRENGSNKIETVHRGRDGTEVPVEITSNLLEYNDRQYSVAFVQDISERQKAEEKTKQLEKALFHSQKMEAVGTLAGGIAHDFNNILSAVIGYSELSLAMSDIDSPVHQHLQHVITAGIRARDLVKQILTFSRKDERHLSPLQMAPLVKEALKLLRSTLPSTIEITQQIAPKTDKIMADPTQIHQIVMNLCTNASHAMEKKGGRLKIELSQITLSEQDIRLYSGLKTGDYIKLSVQDTGCGIPRQELGKIFDPYFTTKEKGKGTGLGLAVVHGIVKSYGGAVYAYSELQIGTTFNVYIPTVRQAHEAASEFRVKADLPGGTEHILLVDDEPELLEVGRLLLERLGYRISIAPGGESALETYYKAPEDIDLVLTDMTMPKMTGDKLALELLKLRPDLPVILCTGYSVQISREKAREIGIKAFISKPIIEADLADVVREVLDGGEADFKE